ncbi:PP0621 family protein [Sulfurimonas sp.]|uniref:PP0621 family protein n=1 Tax=Sulfurimonas sp. TaxID=2022749 RepID=UPI00262738F7|nr:PP0621 family protein [Sulfurimonas sp.]
MILKFLIIAAVISVVYIMFFKTKPATQARTKKPKKAKADATNPEINDMTECASCGVYVEVKEAILSNGKYYCSRECLKEAK